VRAFEAAARLLSFRRAADELCVTPAAVSQQVRMLERHLGHSLFRRPKNGGLTLTESGHVCMLGLRDVFDNLIASLGVVYES
jgi:DNA-binding transcriptional LysR family regulator